MRFLVVAKKEFIDQVTSRKFIATLIVFLLFLGFMLYSGFTGMGPGPSLHFAALFSFIGTGSMSFFGGILGIVLGFDLITKEKESGTLKTLLSHPVFRDEIITGKAIGGFAALAVVVAVTLSLLLGAVVLSGYIPSAEDMVAFLKFAAVTLAYFFTFFALGLFTSAVSKSTTTSLLISIGIFILLAIFIPFFSFMIANAIAGPPPEPPEMDYTIKIGPDGEVTEPYDITEDPRWQEYEKELEEYHKKRDAVESTLMLLSPVMNYMTLANSLASESYYTFESRDLTKNWIGFFATPVIFFAIAYIRFVREELV